VSAYSLTSKMIFCEILPFRKIINKGTDSRLNRFISNICSYNIGSPSYFIHENDDDDDPQKENIPNSPFKQSVQESEGLQFLKRLKMTKCLLEDDDIEED
jgi:hypothetical protein